MAPGAFAQDRLPQEPTPVPMPVPGVGPDLPAQKGDRRERVSTAQERREQRLDRMFKQLANASSKERADRIGRHIMRRLGQSGSDTVDLLMTRAGIAIAAKNYGLALDLLDGVVRMEPEFAEGWNRRATANFLAGDMGASVADIEQVLRYEPRHWGALLGLSMILASIDREREAVAIMDRVLAIHPFLEELKERRDRMAMDLGADI